VGLANGGTGATDAAGARSSLGLGTAATAAATSFLQVANNLSDLNNASTARTNLGLGSAALLASSAVLQSANNLSDLGSVSAARTSLGLSTVAATGAYSDLSGKPTLGSLSTLSTVTLTSNVTGTLPVANGGTNQTSFTTNYVTYFDGTKLTGSSGLQFDGTNLGLGSSPSYSFDIKNSASTAIRVGSSSNNYGTLLSWNNPLGEARLWSLGSYALVLGVNGAESARIDTSGNLGLGVTPSAWGGGFKAMQYLGGSVASQASGYMYHAQNAYYDGSNWRRVADGAAVVYEQSNAQHIWNNIGYGVANATIAFNPVMTLDASGNLGVGTVGPGYKIHAIGTIGTGGASVNGTIAFKRGSDSAEVATISTDGSLLIYNSGVQHEFRTAGSPAVRIDGSGNLLVGQSSTASPGISNTTTGIALSGTYIAASRNGDYSYFANRNTSDGGLFWFGRQGSFIGSISITTTAVAYNQTSDISLKENIAEAPSALQSILSMPVRQFDWKSNGSHTDYGVVAQEVNEYAPEIVTKSDLWCVDYGRITPRLIKAFQELAALEQELRSKVTALEAANGN
jgi:hypothetical protein